MDQLTIIQDRALMVFDRVKRQAFSNPEPNWQQCNEASSILALALWEAGITNLVYLTYRFPAGVFDMWQLNHEWLMWNGTFTIDLTIEQFAKNAEIMNSIGQPYATDDGTRFVFGQSPWHENLILKGGTSVDVDERLVKESGWLSNARDCFGTESLPKCHQLRIMHLTEKELAKHNRAEPG